MGNALIYPIAACVVTVVLHYGFRLSFGVSSLIAFVAWPLIGTIITLDDDLKGGWSNPDGTVTAPWLTAGYWGRILGGASASALAFAFEAGLTSPRGLGILFVAFVLSLLAGSLLFVARRSETTHPPSPGL